MCRVARISPGTEYHDTLVLPCLRIRLHDCFGRLMPNADYELDYGGTIIQGQSDNEAFVKMLPLHGEERCTLRWSRVETEPGQSTAEDTPRFHFELELFLDLLDSESKEGMKRRLHNLGYPIDRDMEANIQDFQVEHGLDTMAHCDDPMKSKMSRIYEAARDEPVEDEGADGSMPSPEGDRT